MPQGAVSNGKHIDAFIPHHLRDMFYRHPTRPYAWNNGLDPYGFSTDELVMYLPLWALNNGGTNSIQSVDAYKHTGTITGALWQPDGRAFDGNDDLISIPDAASLKFGTGDFTVNVWVKTTQDATGKLSVLIAKEDETATRQGWWLFTTALSEPRFEIFSGGVNADVRTTATINDGVWHLITGVKTSSQIELFIDAVSKNTTAHSLGSTDKAIALTIGRKTGGGSSRAFEGLISVGWLYGRAFSGAEITHLRNTTIWRTQ